VTGGARYAKGSVPAATCLVTDAEDGNSNFRATLSTVTGTYASDGIGSQTASCSYTDAGGLTASSSVTYSILDLTTPVVTYSLNPAGPDGANEWYKSDVSLTWTVSDPDSPNSLKTTGCANQDITKDQVSTDYTCTATSAGGTTDPVTATIKRDGTAPNAPTGSLDPRPNSAGWNSTDVTVSFADNGDNGPSGIASCTSPVTVSAEGANQTVTGTCTDMAGNVSSGATVTVNLDKTAPTNLQFQSTPITDGASYYYGSVPAVPSGCTASDEVSGVATCVVTGGDNPGSVGDHTLTATATNWAGLQSTEQVHYTVMAWTL